LTFTGAILYEDLERGVAPWAKSIQKSTFLGGGIPRISLGKASKNSHNAGILYTDGSIAIESTTLHR